MSRFLNKLGKIFAPGEKNDPPVEPRDDSSAEAELKETEQQVPEEVPSPLITMSALQEELDLKQSAHPDSLDWRHSVVDLLILLKQDPSFSARKELAFRFGYEESRLESKGSAPMNIWLHQQILVKTLENGGTFPEENP